MCLELFLIKIWNYDYLSQVRSWKLHVPTINLLSPSIHTQILQTDLHTFVKECVERITDFHALTLLDSRSCNLTAVSFSSRSADISSYKLTKYNFRHLGFYTFTSHVVIYKGIEIEFLGKMGWIEQVHPSSSGHLFFCLHFLHEVKSTSRAWEVLLF